MIERNWLVDLEIILWELVVAGTLSARPTKASNGKPFLTIFNMDSWGVGEKEGDFLKATRSKLENRRRLLGFVASQPELGRVSSRFSLGYNVFLRAYPRGGDLEVKSH